MALLNGPRLMAEWETQQWLWIGFPHLAEEWQADGTPQLIQTAQEQIAGFANAIANSGQEVRLLVRDDDNAARARELVSSKVTLEQRTYGDIWLRDTGPIVMVDNDTPIARPIALRFGFNGWGEKYLMDGDQNIGADLARAAGLKLRVSDWVLEGGAIENDGAGRCLATQQCLLNPNRNPAMNRADIEAALKRDLGFTEILWLGDGLVNDHTDGHVDNLARFVAPGHIALAEPNGHDDPNAHIYADAAERAQNYGLTISRIPSPGLIKRSGQVEPASYANFAITNHLVVVPTFGCSADTEAVDAIAALFPDRATLGLPADAVLAGGGGFHCASMQMPIVNKPFP